MAVALQRRRRRRPIGRQVLADLCQQRALVAEGDQLLSTGIEAD